MSIFNQNSSFIKFVMRILDVLTVNILWLLCSLPIITIGASTCAAFYVTQKMVDDEEGYVSRQFFKGFKDNLKQGTIMWLFTAPSIYVCYLIWQLISKSDDISFIIILGAILYTAIIAFVNIYSYAQIARYKNGLKMIIRNSVAITSIYFPRTILMILIVALEVAIIFWNHYTLAVGAFIGPEIIIYTIAGMTKKIFLQIERHENENSGTINQ